MTVSRHLILCVLYGLISLTPFVCAQDTQELNPTETATGRTHEQRVFELARQLRCPVCRAESAADSNATASVEFRNIIQERIALGENDAEIIAFFQERYGDWILLSPPKRGLHLVVWLVPVMLGLIGLWMLLWLMQRWTARAHQDSTATLSAEDQARVDAALADQVGNGDV